MPEHASSVTRLEMVCHTGTHLDAPSHFVPGAPAIDEIPLARLSGPGELPERVEVMFLPLPITGAEGSPMRALARPRDRA
jgi:kynurenine formamidase